MRRWPNNKAVKAIKTHHCTWRGVIGSKTRVQIESSSTQSRLSKQFNGVFAQCFAATYHNTHPYNTKLTTATRKCTHKHSHIDYITVHKCVVYVCVCVGGAPSVARLENSHDTSRAECALVYGASTRASLSSWVRRVLSLRNSSSVGCGNSWRTDGRSRFVLVCVCSRGGGGNLWLQKNLQYQCDSVVQVFLLLLVARNRPKSYV